MRVKVLADMKIAQEQVVLQWTMSAIDLPGNKIASIHSHYMLHSNRIQNRIFLTYGGLGFAVSRQSVEF